MFPREPAYGRTPTEGADDLRAVKRGMARLALWSFVALTAAVIVVQVLLIVARAIARGS